MRSLYTIPDNVYSISTVVLVAGIRTPKWRIIARPPGNREGQRTTCGLQSWQRDARVTTRKEDTGHHRVAQCIRLCRLVWRGAYVSMKPFSLHVIGSKKVRRCAAPQRGVTPYKLFLIELPGYTVTGTGNLYLKIPSGID